MIRHLAHTGGYGVRRLFQNATDHRVVHPPWRAGRRAHRVPRRQHRSQRPGLMIERVDVFTLPGKSFELQVMVQPSLIDGRQSPT